jgi:hypothetical protein
VGVECVLPSPEDIRALAAADLPNKFAAVPGPTNDFFERHSVPDERRDCGIGLLAPQIAFILDPFRTDKQLQKVPPARTISRLMTTARDHLSKADTVTIAAIEAGVASCSRFRTKMLH